jgi:hypothetical protein
MVKPRIAEMVDFCLKMDVFEVLEGEGQAAGAMAAVDCC